MFESRENVRFSEISYGSVKASDVLLSPSNPIAKIILLSHFCLPLEMERFLLFSAKRTGTQLTACHQTCPFSFWEIWFLASKAPQVLRLPGNFGLLGIRRSSA
jgi:hypothetical protein